MQTTPYAVPVDAPQAQHDAEHKTTDEVRQGTTGHNVRYVLAISLGGALIAFAVVWFWVT